MTVSATFHPRVENSQRVVVAGLFQIYCPFHGHTSALTPGSVRATVNLFGDVLLSTWNSMSTTVEHDGVAHTVHFELRAEVGRSPAVQALVDQSDEGGFGRELRIHTEARQHGWNAVITLPKQMEGRHLVRGRTPGAPPFHRAEADLRVHQPWSNLIVLGPGHTRYTISHEVGHVLGLGEGYYDRLRWTRTASGSSVLAGSERVTDPPARGSPMALPDDSGPDASQGQVRAILVYALAALAAAPSSGQFGPEVDGYRARRVRE